MKKRKMFLYLILFVITIIINIQPGFATGGGLRKNSIKTCPDGVSYGKHSDGNGGMHWHRAATNGNNYYAVGDAIYDDPCPDSSVNKGTAESTDGGNNNSSSNGTSNGYIANNTPVEQKKSSDTSIEYIIINDDKITSISDEMNYETNKKDISIEVKTKSNKAMSKINGNTKDLDSENVNKIEIIVMAEDETTKTYVLNVTRKIIESNVEIKEFKLNDSTIEFENKKGSTFVFNSTKAFTYSYTLSDNNATLKLLTKEGKEITEKKVKLNQGYNYYDLLITDSDGNTNTYELEVERISSGGSIILILFMIGIFLIVPARIGFAVFFIVKNEKEKNQSIRGE